METEEVKLDVLIDNGKAYFKADHLILFLQELVYGKYHIEKGLPDTDETMFNELLSLLEEIQESAKQTP